MIRTDRRMLKNILRLTKDFKTTIALSDDNAFLLSMNDLHNVKKSSVIKGVKPQFAEASILRLIDNGYLRYSVKYSGGFQFSITDKALLRHEIFWDNFTKEYWYGFLSGILSGVIINVVGGILLKYILLISGI